MMISRRHYQLQAPVGATKMIARHGRRVYTFEPDERGVIVGKLPGARYRVLITMTDETRHYQAYIKHVSDQEFTLKLKNTVQ